MADRADLHADQVVELVAAVRGGGQPEPSPGSDLAGGVLERGGRDVVALVSSGTVISRDELPVQAKTFYLSEPNVHPYERGRPGAGTPADPGASGPVAEALTPGLPGTPISGMLAGRRGQQVIAPAGRLTSALGTNLVRWPWLRARVELAYGSWLRRQRRVAQARQPLRSALTTFEVTGAARWAEQARAELRASGERPGPLDAGQLATAAHALLSAQETQIVRLAAEGLSNREIGERLYLSPRTVGSHLYRIFPKLEVTSRTQLAALLGAAMPPGQSSMQSAD